MRTTAVVVHSQTADCAGHEKREMNGSKKEIEVRLTFVMDIKLVPGNDFQDLGDATCSVSVSIGAESTAAYLFKCAKPTGQADKGT